jgi:prepilin-type N-terminal cleavage/methylation domain-containing protein
MKGGKRPLGYTIIEVMIVLAISGIMFLIAATFIGSKQQDTAFNAGVNEVASQVQNTIQQVTSGQYSDIDLDCTLVSPGPPASITISSGTNTQGTNTGCTFLGKLMVFQHSQSSYSDVSLAGGQLNPDAPAFLGVTTSAAQLLLDADPTIITPLTSAQDIPQQIEVQSITIVDQSGAIHHGISNFGFVQNLGTPNGQGSFVSGTQPVSIVYSPVNSSTNISGDLDYAQSVTVCLADGANSTIKADVNIGSTSGNQLGVNVVHVNPGTPCVP